MRENKLVYTNIQHNFRRFHGLSNTEYVLLDMINILSNLDNKSKGWCFQSKDTMAFEMELSKPAILKIIEKLIVNGFLEKHPQTKHLRTTAKWKEVYYANAEKQKQWIDERNELLVIPNGKESLPRKAVKNIGKQSLPSDGKQSLPKEDFSGKESLPNNNTSFYNNSDDNNSVGNLQFPPPLESDLNLSEIPTGSEMSTSEIPNNCENEKTEKPINLPLKEKSTIKNQTRGAGGEKNVSSVDKLDLDKDIAPLGMNNEKLDFIFLESSRIDTSEIRAKFTMWHERRARKTKGVRNCLHYQKIMRLVANSDLSESEVIEGLNMAYEKTWTGLEIEWIKNKTRLNKTQNNGNYNKQQGNAQPTIIFKTGC